MPEESEEFRKKLLRLSLNDAAVAERERERERERPEGGAPWWILVPYQVLCVVSAGV